MIVKAQQKKIASMRGPILTILRMSQRSSITKIMP